MNSQDEEKVPLWYYRSDDRPMENLGVKENWTLYNNSEEIEAWFQVFIDRRDEYEINDNPYAIYELESKYFIDFRENVQKDIDDHSKQRIVGRFIGDSNSQNTLDDTNLIIIQKIRSMKPLTDSGPKSIKSSMLFDENETFIQYSFLDVIFKLIDKIPNEKQAKDDLIQYSYYYIDTYETKKEEQKNILKLLIDEMENGKINENSVKWYTKECFIYRMINTCLRKMDYIEIFHIRYFVFHLRNNLKELSKTNKTKKLFRGTKVPTDEIEKMKNFIGQPFQLNGFISTSGDITVAKGFMNAQKLNENQFSRVLFEIDAEEEEMTNFSCIRDFSAFPKEDEHLININIFLKIKKIEENTNEVPKFYHFYLQFSNESELKVQQKTLDYKQSLMKILDTNYKVDSFYLAEILFTLEKGQATIDLLNKISKEQQDSEYFNLIGSAYYLIGNYDKAIEFYQKQIDIIGHHPHTGSIYNNIGVVYNIKGDYDKAIEFYEKSLKINLETFGKDTLEIADQYNNLGVACNKKGNYGKAIEYYQKSLEISLNKNGFNHPSTASSYNNIGSAYNNNGDSNKALEFSNKSLEIYLNTLGSNHPSTATTYMYIGMAYNSIGDYSKAIDFCNKSLEIFLNTLGSNHQRTAGSYNNLGFAYNNIGDYDKAIEFCDKSLQIYLNTLGNNHPSTASSYMYIGMAYNNIGDYKKAIEFCDKSLQIYLNTLGSNHPSTANSLYNLGLAYNKNGDYNKAIEFCEKSLKIYLNNSDFIKAKKTEEMLKTLKNYE